MNDTELRQRQLARLRGVPIEASPIDSAQFVPDAGLDADYASHCKSAKDWEREPEPRAEWEREHKESMQRLNIQPENEIEPEPFIVGSRRNEFGELIALPAPKWPHPGQPKTLEISRAHFDEGMLQADATHALNDCVRWLAYKLRDPDSWDDVYSGPPAKLFDVAWSFLLGTFRARNIELPSDTQMNEWAKQYNAAVATKTKRAHEGRS